MQLLRQVILLIIVVFPLFSCNGQYSQETSSTQENTHKKGKNNKSKKLNESAVELMEKAGRYEDKSSIKDSLLKEALKYSNKAIKKNNEFFYAYFNKANILIEMDKYSEAISVLEPWTDEKSTHPEAIFIIGLLYEKTNQKEKAHEKFQKALKVYEEIVDSPEGTERDRVQKYQVILFLEGKEEALERLNKEIEKDPDNVDLSIAKKIIEGFDSEKFIEEF